MTAAWTGSGAVTGAEWTTWRAGGVKMAPGCLVRPAGWMVGPLPSQGPEAGEQVW